MLYNVKHKYLNLYLIVAFVAISGIYNKAYGGGYSAAFNVFIEEGTCIDTLSICHTPTTCINKEWSIENNTIVPSSGQLFTYRYGDGTAPSSSAVHSYSLTGAYTITVTAEANASCPAKSFRSLVIVNDKCEIPVCVNDISICHAPTACINKEWSIENNTITPSSGQLFTYRYGDGTAPSSSSVHSYSLTGAYTITVTAEANASCPAKSFRSLVIVNDNCETPVCVNNISLCHPPTACINKEWSIENNTIAPSSGQLFTYNYGDGTSPSTSSVHSYSLTGAYTVTVTAEANVSCPAKSFRSLVSSK